MSAGEKPIDYGMAEALAFASLVENGIPVRLSGQDSRRGTFNHRHAALIDVENESVHMPLAAMAHAGAFFEAYDSMLSEAAVMGFERLHRRDVCAGDSSDIPDPLPDERGKGAARGVDFGTLAKLDHRPVLAQPLEQACGIGDREAPRRELARLGAEVENQADRALAAQVRGGEVLHGAEARRVPLDPLGDRRIGAEEDFAQ